MVKTVRMGGATGINSGDRGATLLAPNLFHDTASSKSSKVSRASGQLLLGQNISANLAHQIFSGRPVLKPFAEIEFDELLYVFFP